MSTKQLVSSVLRAVYAGSIRRHHDGSWSVRVGTGLLDWAVPDERVEDVLNRLRATGGLTFDTTKIAEFGFARAVWADVTVTM